MEEPEAKEQYKDSKEVMNKANLSKNCTIKTALTEYNSKIMKAKSRALKARYEMVNNIQYVAQQSSSNA